MAAAAISRVSSGLAYPDRFYPAANYAGFGGSPTSSSKGVTSKFSNNVALLLHLSTLIFSSFPTDISQSTHYPLFIPPSAQTPISFLDINQEMAVLQWLGRRRGEMLR